jgi:hypothetical protein
MDGEVLHVRPAEALYLYERLVLYKQPKETAYRYAIQRLRERYGTDFLAEIVGHNPSGGTEGKLRRAAFERILQDYLEKGGCMAYAEWGYRFDFLNGSYTWDGEELRVTPRDAVFLYERLILGLRGKRGLHRYTVGSVLFDMRKRFGRQFLQEPFQNKGIGAGFAASTDGPKPAMLQKEKQGG